MSGKYSREKGMRNERLLRDALRAEGFTSHRVPLSGAQEGYKGDVVFSKDGRTWVAEAKLRGGTTFKRIYDAIDRNGTPGAPRNAASTAQPDLQLVRCGLCVAVDELDEEGQPLRQHLISVHTSATDAVQGPEYYTPFEQLSEDKVIRKAVHQLVSIRYMMGTSDFLVIRGDRKPFLFIRYR